MEIFLATSRFLLSYASKSFDDTLAQHLTVLAMDDYGASLEGNKSKGWKGHLKHISTHLYSMGMFALTKAVSSTLSLAGVIMGG